jgi:hypothetical protein
MVRRYLLCVLLVYRKIINTNSSFYELMDPDITNTYSHSRLDVHLVLLLFYILLEALRSVVEHCLTESAMIIQDPNLDRDQK